MSALAHYNIIAHFYFFRVVAFCYAPAESMADDAGAFIGHYSIF